jgi:hypothetical protein
MLQCVGSISQASLNVRVGENVQCSISALDSLGQPALVSPADFMAPIVVGGVGLSSISQPSSNSSIVVFTVQAPSVIGQRFELTGVLFLNGQTQNFTQGALSLAVGEYR